MLAKVVSFLIIKKLVQQIKLYHKKITTHQLSSKEVLDQNKKSALQLVKTLYKTKYYKDWENGVDSLPWIEEGLSEKDFSYCQIGQNSQDGLIFKSELPHENRVNFILLNNIENSFSPVLELSNVNEYSITSDNKFLIVDKGGKFIKTSSIH